MAKVRFYGAAFIDEEKTYRAISGTNEFKYWEDVLVDEYISDDANGLAFKPMSFEILEGDLKHKPIGKEKLANRFYEEVLFFGGFTLGVLFTFILMRL